MKNFEKKFWSSGEFTKPNGGEYKGYVSIKNNQGYDYITGEQLEKKHNYLVNFRTSPMFFDRLLDDELSLPYNKHQVSFAPNDFLNKTTLKSILKRLQYNNHYLFRCSTISETRIPNASSNEISVLSTYNEKGKLTPKNCSEQLGHLINDLRNNGDANYNIDNFKTILKDTTFFSTEHEEARFDLCQLKNAEITVLERLKTDNTVKLNLLLLLTFKTKIAFVRFVYEVDAQEQDANQCFLDFTPDSYNTIVLELVDPHNKNSLKFMDLVDAKIQGNQLFVLDKKLNMLIKYDISCFVDASSFWNINQLRFVSSLQGTAKTFDKNYFNSPTALAVSDKYVYVADVGTVIGDRCIKKFTTELDYQQTIRNGKYANNEVCSINHCPYTFTLDDGTVIPPDSLWVVSQSTNHVYLTIMSSDKQVFHQQLHKVVLTDDSTGVWTEKAKTIQFSYSDSSYYYLITTNKVYKFHTSRPSEPLAVMGSYYEEIGQTVYNIWNSSAFSWDKVFDYNLTWDYDIQNQDGASSGLRNMCFCLTGDDSFNGDITFHLAFSYNISSLRKQLKKYNADFDNLPSWVKAENITQPNIMLYNERHGFISNITTTDFLCYENEDIEEINDDEYIDALTFNKCIYKVAFNLIQLKNVLKGRFGAYYDKYNLVKFDEIITSDIYFEKIQRMRDENFFLHENEPNTILINRVFECIWNLQQDILMRMEMVYRTTSETCIPPFIYV